MQSLRQGYGSVKLQKKVSLAYCTISKCLPNSVILSSEALLMNLQVDPYQKDPDPQDKLCRIRIPGLKAVISLEFENLKW